MPKPPKPVVVVLAPNVEPNVDPVPNVLPPRVFVPNVGAALPNVEVPAPKVVPPPKVFEPKVLVPKPKRKNSCVNLILYVTLREKFPF